MKHREIKFRIFTRRYCDNESDKGLMIYMGNGIKQRYDFEDGFVYAFCIDEYSDFNGHEKYEDDEPFEVMQYTGLTDKNGKEIYEGDIIDEKYNFLVVFENGAFYAKRETAPSYLLSVFLEKRNIAGSPCQIIGNIYDNPELLSK